ncbi:DUF2971 domain-containing protein [Rhizobium leguminosarum]|uniref:DUF2971 domain-containing protein n=1 Tax=Rhizobium leguminosarum TaxID=384 RepID=UPI001038CDF5|nr:DUF2971 domain-containing protein [Rhizobium leguminosarum]TCA80203.1 DUF2971 domain-containing protein [Rhizobium leguminosarum bv. viciae]TCA91101.1 DUF2971 domain-containing protein [Rhizobium leguminosarum bv. viciae]
MEDASSDEKGSEGLEQQPAALPVPFVNVFDGLAEIQIQKIYENVIIPTTLFHYTSAQGLIGILSEHKLWFSDATFMNDGSEVVYGVDVAAYAIREFVEDKTDAEKNAGSELIDQIADAMRHYQPIIFCMSARNNLLNQWRDYGRDVVPYCIEFDVTELEKWQLRNFPHFLTKVVYDAQFQKDLMTGVVKDIYEKAIALKGERERFDDDEAKRLSIAAAMEIVKLITRFKNSAFEAEEEYRAICYRPDIESNSVPRKYRSSSLGVVPYYEWVGKEGPLPLPVVSVTVGPSPYATVSDLALKQFLADQGYNVPTYFSKIPIRR